MQQHPFEDEQSTSRSVHDVEVGNQEVPVVVDCDKPKTAYLRDDSDMPAMGGRDRWQRKIKGCLRSVICCGKEDKGSTWDGSIGERSKQKQYRLESTKGKSNMGQSWWHRIACWHRRIQQQIGIGISPNQSLAMYLHWMFRVNFFFLFTLSCIVFFALTIFFAGLIIAAGRMDEECVRVGGKTFESAGTAFADAFALSWTTFSTVGYGICSLESFIGVLYSGFCGAILFGKVLRIQSHAQVIFSDPIVIRYGSGVENHSDHEDDEIMDEDGKGGETRLPCPVLEFRIVNRLFNEVGGEIMDATLNVVTNVDADDADQSFGDAYESQSSSLPRLIPKRDESFFQPLAGLPKESGAHAPNETSDRSVFSGGLTSMLRMNGVSVDDSPRLVNKRIFSKLLIEASDHPFFKRVWLARHVLDENSPILSPGVRRQIRKSNGYWPDHLNSYQGVKESLRFNQILVSLNGVSNVSASDVYAQKIYDHVDCNVGYQFVNLLYRDGDQLKVDTDLINDVREQNGGGGEPLSVLPE